MADTLFGAPRRRKGAQETALDTTLRAWSAEDRLNGPEFAAVRAILREAARAVDVAHADLQDGGTSALSLSRSVKTYWEILSAYSTVEEVQSHDAIDQLIADLNNGPSVGNSSE